MNNEEIAQLYFNEIRNKLIENIDIRDQREILDVLIEKLTEHKKEI